MSKLGQGVRAPPGPKRRRWAKAGGSRQAIMALAAAVRVLLTCRPHPAAPLGKEMERSTAFHA
eukprot:2736213-Prorocentrum_lima.AAC.1